jgi:hypothetical protein
MCKSMDEQVSTWMAWILSSKCLALLYTSTQSSNLKWVSGGGINSSRQPKSHWLTATEKYTVRWTDGLNFTIVGSFGAPPRHLAIEILWHIIRCLHRQGPHLVVGSYGAKSFVTTNLQLASSGLSDEPLLHSQFIQCWSLYNLFLSILFIQSIR